jgi:hypothetical protein
VTDRGWAGGPAASSVVIDLGLVEHEPPASPEPDGRGPRPSPVLVILLVLAFCVVALTTSAAPPPLPVLVLSTERAIDPPRLVGGALITYAASDGDNPPTITAYALADGRVRWRQRTSRRMRVVPAGPVTLLTPAACLSMEEFTTEALDASGGDPRWKLPGAPVWMVAGGDLVVIRQPVTGCAEATGGFDPLPSAPFVWSGVDVATGVVRWSMRIEAGETLAAGGDDLGQAAWFAIARSDRITTFDLRTGAVVATLDRPGAPPPPAVVRVIGDGDRMLVLERSPSAVAVRSYTAPELTGQWQTTVAPPPGIARLELDTFVARDCGSLICLGPPTETVGLDPVSGQERWRLPGRPLRVGARYGLFIRAAQAARLPMLTVYDLGTGRATRTLPDGLLIGGTEDGVLLNVPGTAGGTLWRLGLTAGDLHLLTPLPRRYVDCDSLDRYLACRATDGSLNVWRLPVRCPPECGPVPLPASKRRT